MKLAAFIWLLVSLLFIIMGLYCLRTKSQKPTGFWANGGNFPVKDACAYNRDMGKLWLGYGAVMAVLGLPLLLGQNSPAVLLTIFGVVAETIAAMAVYVLVIEKKHRKR